MSGLGRMCQAWSGLVRMESELGHSLTLGYLDCTKMLRQEMITIVSICVLCARKGPLTRDIQCRDSKDVLCHHPEHWVCGAFTLHNQSLRESKMIELSLPSKTQACQSHPIQVDCWGSALALQKDCWLEPHVHVELDLLRGGMTPWKLLQVFSRLLVQIWTWGFPAQLISCYIVCCTQDTESIQ